MGGGMSELLDAVDAALIAHHEPSIVLATLRATTSLASLLGSIRADASRLKILADRSYRHHNGFDKIVLASPASSPLKLVLHVWPRGGAADANDIHDHRWDFASVVLCGALRVELYEPDVSGRSYSVMRYRPMPGAENYDLQPSGTMAVSAQASVTITVGSAYSWAADLLHRAWGLPGQTTATLIVQGPPTRASTTVLARTPDARRLADGGRLLHQLRADEVDNTLAALTRGKAHTAWQLPGPQVPAQRSSGSSIRDWPHSEGAENAAKLLISE